MVRLAVLVPVLGRPANVAPFVASLQAATTTEHRIVWLCSPGDDEEIAACRETDGEVMVMPWEPDRGDFSKKINYGFAHTSEPWLFQGADDIRFTGGWDVQALAAAERTGRGVVGTNDLGNPLVKRGVHSTHTFFSRDYIERFGGTVDKTGLVFSETYWHEYCDNEFVETAKARGQFVFSKRSFVEHFHPHWGKSEMDATYEKATRESRKDRELFAQRLRKVRTREIRLQLQQEKRTRMAARRARQ